MCSPRTRFQKIETLPGLPEEETAQKILETLADDPGIRAVLEKHRWTVGALCELYPEGKVGISVMEMAAVISTLIAGHRCRIRYTEKGQRPFPARRSYTQQA